MEYDVVEDVQNGEWLVQAWNVDGDGEGYSARFYMHDAERRAREYALWMNTGKSRCFSNTVLPTEFGLYYYETCDEHGNPYPGLMLLTEDAPTPQIDLDRPTKIFGPIPAAMKPWPMVPVTEAV